MSAVRDAAGLERIVQISMCADSPRDTVVNFIHTSAQVTKSEHQIVVTKTSFTSNFEMTFNS